MRRWVWGLLVLVSCGGEGGGEDEGVQQGRQAGVRYDLEGLPSCSRLSALASWRGSCDEGEACAWAPELGAGVCAPGCDAQADCADGSVCRRTDDGDGWIRWWCAPHAPGPM